MLKSLIGASIAAMTLLGGVANAADVTIRFPVEYALEITPGQANQEFKRLVEERSNGRIEVKLYPSGSLYKGLDLLQAVLRGDAEMTTLISAYWSAVAPKSAVFELPYVFPTKAAFYKAIDDGFFEKAYQEAEAKGAKLLTVLPFDYLVPGTRTTPLREPGDFAGLKFRGLGKTNLAMLKLFGATPVSINFVEISPAIQQGLIDALNVPTDNYMIYKWYESIKNVTYAPYYIAFYPWMVNARWWNSLDPELQTIIQEAAIEVAQKNRAVAEAASDKALKDLAGVGVDVHVQTPEEIAIWAEAAKPIWDEFTPQIGDELINEIQTYRQ
ncbi:TRAP transporter substrate-binding protein [Acuticoccus kandeliae]|uniref:TRAP transporter substrate-binding protein n=1 Tax=Acuticoccus kandeliae TaxID=2073160 RepID=UPI0013004BCF|nr:TRAP transporter substrate-binding protein DctP [Acuticoccus kandeliae]